MSQIKLDNLAAIMPTEPFSAETGLLQILPTGTDSFDNHLQRAKSRPDEPNTTADSEPSDAESSRRPGDVQPAADDRSDDREDSAPVEPQAKASEESSPDRPTEDAPVESDGSEQPAAQDTDDSTENHPDEPSEEDVATEPNAVLVGEQLVDTPPGEVTGEAAAQAMSDSQNNAGNRHGPQGLVPEQDNVVQQSPADEASGRVLAEVEAAAPVADEEALLQTTAETTEATGEKSEKRAEDAGEEPEKPALPGGKKGSAAVEQIEQHAGETVQAAIVADLSDAAVLPAEAPQSPHRSRGKKDPVVEVNDDNATHRVAANPAAPNAVATPEVQAITMEAVVGSEVRAEPAVNTGGPASNDAAGSQDQTSIRDGAVASKGPQQAAGGDGVDRVRFVQRVARAFEAIGDRSRSVRLRLSPPELGSLRLEVTVRNGVMNARVEAETATARNLLLDNLGALRERLALQDIKIEQFTVELTDRSPGGPFDEQAGQMQGQDGDSADDLHGPNAETETSEQTEPAAGAVNRPGEGTQLNVVI